MKTLLKGLGVLLAAVALGLAGLVLVARSSDGPLAIIAGGPFKSGELVGGAEPDWSFVRDVKEVEFQLVAPPRSRVTWVLEHGGRAYIPSGYMTTTWGKLWKQWPLEAMEDDRAILRIDGRLYERTLVRIEEGPQLAPLLAQLGQKYLGGADVPVESVRSGSLWLFELAPRR